MAHTNIPVWSDDEHHAVDQLTKTLCYREIGERYGITKAAVINRIWRWRQRGDATRAPRPLMVCDIARVLGCPFYTVRTWKRTGKITLPLRGATGGAACSIRDLVAFLEHGYALCLSIQPPPTELFWRREVARIRHDLRLRWVDQRALRQALGVSMSTMRDWRYIGFPRPMINLCAYGIWLERTAVIAWLNQWPRRYTKAAKRLLEQAS